MTFCKLQAFAISALVVNAPVKVLGLSGEGMLLHTYWHAGSEDEEYLLVSLSNAEDCIILHDFETKNHKYLFWLNACITVVY